MKYKDSSACNLLFKSFIFLLFRNWKRNEDYILCSTINGTLIDWFFLELSAGALMKKASHHV